jgi:hypothetical protein
MAIKLLEDTDRALFSPAQVGVIADLEEQLTGLEVMPKDADDALKTRTILTVHDGVRELLGNLGIDMMSIISDRERAQRAGVIRDLAEDLWRQLAARLRGLGNEVHAPDYSGRISFFEQAADGIVGLSVLPEDVSALLAEADAAGFPQTPKADLIALKEKLQAAVLELIKADAPQQAIDVVQEKIDRQVDPYIAMHEHSE